MLHEIIFDYKNVRLSDSQRDIIRISLELYKSTMETYQGILPRDQDHHEIEMMEVEEILELMPE